VRERLRAGLVGAADRMHKKPSGVVHRVDVALGIAKDERHDPQASRECLIDSTVLIRGESVAPAAPLD